MTIASTNARSFSRVSSCIVALVLLGTGFAVAQPLPQPRPLGPGSCPHGYTSSGTYCVPAQGAQDSIPKPRNGVCPHGWTASGDFCLRSGSTR